MSVRRVSLCREAPLWLQNFRASSTSFFQSSSSILESGQIDPVASRFLSICQRGCRCRRGAQIEWCRNSDPYPIGELLFALIAFSRLKSNLRSTQKFLCAALVDSSNWKGLGFGLLHLIEVIEATIAEILLGYQEVLGFCCLLNHWTIGDDWLLDDRMELWVGSPLVQGLNGVGRFLPGVIPSK